MKPEDINLHTYRCTDGRFMIRTWIREDEAIEDVTGQWFVKYKDFVKLQEEKREVLWQPIATCPVCVMVVFWLPILQRRAFGYREVDDASGMGALIHSDAGMDTPKFWCPLPAKPPCV